MTCLCGADAIVTCSTCSRGYCGAHAARAITECPNCGCGWIQTFDHDSALRLVQERVAASARPSHLSWALVLASRLGCSEEEVNAAAARGRALRERRRLRALEGAVA